MHHLRNSFPAFPSPSEQSGWIVTVANVGDSRAVADTGAETVLLTEDHRVATHQGERRRLDAMGASIAPIDVSGADSAGVLARVLIVHSAHRCSCTALA